MKLPGTSAATVLLCLASPCVFASGYHPDLDEAFAKAEVVVVGRVVDAWEPEPKKRPSNLDRLRLTRNEDESQSTQSVEVEALSLPDLGSGRVYQMRVERVFKGAVQRGQEVVFWDRVADSTAGYGVIEKARNLVFLVASRPSDFELRRYSFCASVRHSPIESIADEGDAVAFRAWVRLLEIGVGTRRPGDLSHAFRTILAKEDNPILLRYVAEHWPGRLTPRDRDLFAGVLERDKAGGWRAATSALRLLLADGVQLDDATVLDLLRTSGPDMRSDLLRLVGPTNIGSCQDLLWGWLLEDGPAVDDLLVDRLARFAPDFVKARLREQDLPFWKATPILRRLGINGGAVGRQDFAPEALALQDQTLLGLAQWSRGDRFLACLAMWDPPRNSDWRTAFPLLAPSLKGEDTPARRQLVAMMRTFGVSVSREGGGYQADFSGRTTAAPVELRVRSASARCRADESCAIEIDEVARSEAWLSFVGEVYWTSYRIGAETTLSGEPTDVQQVFGQDAPRSEFVLLRSGDRRTTTRPLTFERPGRYQISAHKGYFRDGGSVGLDAWTGVVFAEPIEIEVVE